jgi:hypothetical protein
MWNTLLITSGVGLSLGAVTILTHDVAQELRHRRSAGGDAPPAPMLRVHWRTTLAFAMLAWAPLLLALGLLVSACGAGRAGIG